MTLDTMDALWNIPLMIIAFGGLWQTFRTQHDPARMWYWHMGSALVWYVNTWIEVAQGDELWSWLSAFVGTMGLCNGLSTYYQAKRKEEARKRLEADQAMYFDMFRIDDKK